MKLIALDGPSACGKTSVLDWIEAALTRTGMSVSRVGEMNPVRDLFSNLRTGNIGRLSLPPLTESLFWTMNQAYRAETEFTKDHDILLVDRYIYTPIVYQYLRLKEKGVEFQEVIEYIAKPFGVQLPAPHLSFVLTAPIETLEERFKQREGRNMNDAEKDMTKKAINLYHRLKDHFPNYYLIDASGPTQKTCRKIEKIVRTKL